MTIPTPVAGADEMRSARERILDAAIGTFYANGIHATSADRIIEQAGITKVTFYRHFRSKVDLIVAYLELQVAAERAMYEQARSQGNGLGALSFIAAAIGEGSCQPGFRGCPFINAAAEFPDGGHRVREVVDAHRRWTHDMFAGIAAEADVRDVEVVAGQLMMLRDGALVGGYLGAADSIARALDTAFIAVITAGRSLT